MDIALLFDRNTVSADIALNGPDLLIDHDLETAVLISLFTNRRANVDDLVDGDDRQGWWADTYSEIQNDKIGSRLWLLMREKQTTQTRNRAYAYVVEALQWLIDDNVAQEVNVEVEWVSMGLLGIRIEIIKPSNEVFKFQYAWNQL